MFIGCLGNLNGIFIDVIVIGSVVGVVIVDGVIIVIVLFDFGIEDDFGNVVIYELDLILIDGCVIWDVICIFVIFC